MALWLLLAVPIAWFDRQGRWITPGADTWVWIKLWLYWAVWASVPAIAYALASGLLVTAAHADNIARLRAGTERRIGQKAEVTPDGAR